MLWWPTPQTFAVENKIQLTENHQARLPIETFVINVHSFAARNTGYWSPPKRVFNWKDNFM